MSSIVSDLTSVWKRRFEQCMDKRCFINMSKKWLDAADDDDDDEQQAIAALAHTVMFPATAIASASAHTVMIPATAIAPAHTVIPASVSVKAIAEALIEQAPASAAVSIASSITTNSTTLASSITTNAKTTATIGMQISKTEGMPHADGMPPSHKALESPGCPPIRVPGEPPSGQDASRGFVKRSTPHKTEFGDREVARSSSRPVKARIPFQSTATHTGAEPGGMQYRAHYVEPGRPLPEHSTCHA